MNNHIEELTAKVKARGKNRTPEEARELLQKARILDEKGELTEFFQPKECKYAKMTEKFCKFIDSLSEEEFYKYCESIDFEEDVNEIDNSWR
jgi:hypothetical protein